MTKEKKFEVLTYALSALLFLSGFVYLKNVWMARHDMLQVSTELSSSMGPHFMDLSGFRLNLNLGTPSWVIAEFLFGQDPLLLTFSQVTKLLGLGPEFTYIFFLLLIQIFNCLFLLLTLKLLNRLPLHINFFLASTFFLSSNLFSLMTQGHGEIFLFRYLAGFIFSYLWFLRYPTKRKLGLVILLALLQISGYQSLYSITASLFFVFAQKATYKRLREFLKMAKSNLVLSMGALSSLIITLLPLWFAFQNVRADLTPSVRQSTGPYRGGFAGYFLFPEIVHGGIYVPLSILSIGIITRIFIFFKKMRNHKLSKQESACSKISLLIPILGCVLLSSLALGSENNSLLGLSLEAKTILGLRNFGFLESAATYYIYLYCLIWISRLQELWSSKESILNSSKIRTSGPTNTTEKINPRFGFISTLIAAEICLLAYNQPMTFGSQGKSLEWAQIDHFQTQPYENLEYDWLPYYPYVYSTGIFEESAMLVPKEVTFETNEEFRWCLGCDRERSSNVPQLTQFSSTWGRSEKISLVDLIEGEPLGWIQTLKTFDQAYKAQGFYFIEKIDRKNVTTTFYGRDRIDPIIKLNRGGVPNRILFIDTGLNNFLESSRTDRKKREFLSYLMDNPIFLYYKGQIGPESLIRDSKLEYSYQGVDVSGQRVRLAHSECEVEVQFQNRNFLVQGNDGCDGIGLGIRTVDTPQWNIYSNKGVGSTALPKKPYLNFLLGINEISSNSKSYEIRYENTPYAVASVARITMQTLWFSFFVFLLHRRAKSFKLRLKQY